MKKLDLLLEQIKKQFWTDLRSKVGPYQAENTPRVDLQKKHADFSKEDQKYLMTADFIETDDKCIIHLRIYDKRFKYQWPMPKYSVSFKDLDKNNVQQNYQLFLKLKDFYFENIENYISNNVNNLDKETFEKMSKLLSGELSI